MAIVNISGIEFQSITGLVGVNRRSIQKIAGKLKVDPSVFTAKKSNISIEDALSKQPQPLYVVRFDSGLTKYYNDSDGNEEAIAGYYVTYDGEIEINRAQIDGGLEQTTCTFYYAYYSNQSSADALFQLNQSNAGGEFYESILLHVGEQNGYYYYDGGCGDITQLVDTGFYAYNDIDGNPVVYAWNNDTLTASIPMGPTCTTYDNVLYSDKSLLNAISDGFMVTIEVDDSGENSIFYAEGSCGDSYASTGYYVIDTGKHRYLYFFWESETQQLMILDAPTTVTEYSFGYAPQYTAPGTACTDTNPKSYWLDTSTNILYKEDPSTNSSPRYADPGYYSDGITIYSWINDGWSEYAPCVPTGPGPTLTSPITLQERVYYSTGVTYTSLEANSTFPITNQVISNKMQDPNFTSNGYADTFYLFSDRGEWSGTGDITYMYKWYIDGNLVNSAGPYPYFNAKSGQMEDDPNSSTGFTTNEIGKSITFEVVATDANGATTESISINVEDPVLNTYLRNTGITDSTTIDALKYLRRQMLKPRANSLYGDVNYVFYNFESLLTDYYPIAGNTRDQQKWSMKNPDYAFQFEGNLAGFRTSYWGHNSSGMYSTDTQNNNNAIVSEFSTTYNATPASGSIGFAFGMYTNTDYTRPLGSNTGVVYLNGFRYDPSYITYATNSAGYITNYYTGSVAAFGTNFPQMTPYVWAKGFTSNGSLGLSGLIVQDGTNHTNYSYNSKVYGKVFTSGSIFSEWLFTDWPITGSNQLPTPDTRLQITGDHPWNIQFVYATKLPIYRETPYNTYGSAYYLQQLNTVIKTYQSMLGR